MIKAIAPYFGGKRTLAAEIVNQMTGGKRIKMGVIPFAGSMAVPFELAGKAGSILATDLHEDVINVCRVLVDVDLGERVIGWLRRTMMARPAFDQLMSRRGDPWALDDTRDPDEADAIRAYVWLATEWMGNNGYSGTDSQPAFQPRYNTNGGDGATRLKNWVDGLLVGDPIPKRGEAISGHYVALIDTLRCITYEREDFRETLKKVDDAEGVAVYADPPYLRSTRARGQYAHDWEDAGMVAKRLPGFDLSDSHDELAASLAKFSKARIVVSYYDDPRLEELYRGWSRIVLPTTKATSETRETADEVLLINGEPTELLDSTKNRKGGVHVQAA